VDGDDDDDEDGDNNEDGVHLGGQHAVPGKSTLLSQQQQQQQQQQPPLGVTGVLCDTDSLQVRGRGMIQYTVFRPRYVKMKPPMLCVAGGPYLVRIGGSYIICVCVRRDEAVDTILNTSDQSRDSPLTSSIIIIINILSLSFVLNFNISCNFCSSPLPLVLDHQPWQYLSPLVHLVNDRSIIFFNPIGCGRSKRSEEKTSDNHASATAAAGATKNNIHLDESSSSPSLVPSTNMNTATTDHNDPVKDTVRDLIHLVQHLQLQHYHLYGHSFGGIVAYEALSDDGMPGACLSLTLSSTPTDLPHALRDIDRIKARLKSEVIQRSTSSFDDPDHAVAECFAEQYECRVRPLPLQLQQSFAMAGFHSSPAGWQSIKDYVVQTPAADKKLKLPLLLLRGEFDFISNACMEPWWDCVESTLTNDERSIVTMPGVAHYGMLEDERGYGAVIREFLARVPEPALQIPRPSPPPPSSSRPRSRLSR